jgi:diguanylate cyclase (GGDEF)-like protein/PAS domain S-box-containing protein
VKCQKGNVLKIKKPIINASNSGPYDSDASTLQDLHLLLGLLFKASEDAVFVFDTVGHIVYANDKQLQLIDLTEKQVLGKSCTEVLTDHLVNQDYSGIVNNVIATKKSHTTTQINHNAHDEVVTFSPVISQQGVVLGVISITKQTPIESQMSEQEIKRKAVYQKAMMDSIPFMIWLKDKDSHILTANIAYAEMAGFTDPKYLEGKTDYDLWPNYLASNYVEDDLKVLSSGEPAILTEQVKKTNGDVQWVETFKAPVIVDGEVIGTVGYARDVSEKKQLVTTIIEKDMQFTSLLKSLPISIIRYDNSCRRVFINMAENDVEMNVEIRNMMGKTPLEAWSPNIKNITAEAFQNKLMHVLYHGESQTFESHCEIGDRTIVSMVNLVPEFDENRQVIGAVAIANDVTEISKYRHDLEHMAYHDALTSLPNRALLNQRLQMAATKGERFGLMFMDLDFFKSINDTLGHIIGDELLKDAAKRILSSVRNSDVVARIGGDEFAILVPDLKDNGDLAVLAEKIAEKLSAPFAIEGINFFVTASIGIACYPTDSEDVGDLIKYADTAMYDAKKQGRNNYQFYTPELTQEAMEHLAIATALRYAIQKNELYLLFQPKVEISTGRILGAEALLRWQGKVLGQIQPDKFIPIAEESGLIIDIGAWVLRASCEAAVQLNKHRQAPLNMAINVSSKEFVGNNFIENLQSCLQETGCKPEWLTLEITESLLLHDSGKSLETLIKIDEMGITLSIDDFGTGYSALAYLSKFPIRQVKIDRSFVMDICTSHNAACLVKAIIAMALSLNKDLVAEGIETQEQADLIREYNCNQAQGYLFSKPLSFSEFSHLAAQQKIH